MINYLWLYESKFMDAIISIRIGLEINFINHWSYMLKESLWDTTLDCTVDFSLRKHEKSENQEAAIEVLWPRGLNSL